MQDHDTTRSLHALETALAGQRWPEAALAMEQVLERVSREDVDAFVASGMVSFGLWIEVLVRTGLHATSPMANHVLQRLLRKVWDCACVGQRGHLLSFWMAVCGVTFHQAVDEHTVEGCIDRLSDRTRLPRDEIVAALLAHVEIAPRQASHTGRAVQ